VAQIRAGGRDHVGAIVLGRDAPTARLDHWLAVAAPVDGFMGFAIGRSIWEGPIADHIGGKVGDEETADRIAGRYLGFARQYCAAVRQNSAEGLAMGIFGDGRGQPVSGRTAVKRPRPVAGGGCDRCHVASAKVEVITRAGSVFLCSHHHTMHRNAILAAGYQVRAGLSLGH